jgi:Spy/CpxP family protein refolding chaperone
MRTLYRLGFATLLALAMSGGAVAQEPVPQSGRTGRTPRAMQGPRSIDQELDHLTKELELTPAQRAQVTPLLQKHHDRIQALFDANPTLSRTDLAPRIHAISDDTHHEIEALLTEHQRQLAKAMQSRMHGADGRGGRVPPGQSR